VWQCLLRRQTLVILMVDMSPARDVEDEESSTAGSEWLLLPSQPLHPARLRVSHFPNVLWGCPGVANIFCSR
jgi:hypothetical protein